MRLLLDTHALLWWLLADRRLTPKAGRSIRDESNDVLVSSVSGFEIATKQRLGKLGIAGFDPAALPRLLRDSRFDVLPISLDHALAAGALEGPHRDPFDRLLIAQCRIEAVPIITRDPVFVSYGVSVLW